MVTRNINLPPGKRAFVMHVDMGSNQPKLYIKLQLGSGKIIGRSFHYSKVEQVNPPFDDAKDE